MIDLFSSHFTHFLTSADILKDGAGLRIAMTITITNDMEICFHIYVTISMQ